MNARRWLTATLALVGLVAFLGFVAIVPFDREPRHQGRSLSQWLAVSHSATVTPAQREESAAAIRQIGAEGLPMLVSWVADAPGPKYRVRMFITKYPSRFIPRFIRRWAYQPRDYIKPNQARLGFMILGPLAAPAMPSLSRLATSSSSAEVRAMAVNILGDIGPSALPALLAIAQTPGAASRSGAIHQISKLGTNALPAVPILINLLGDPQMPVPLAAATALGQLTLDPTNSVRALLKCLQHPDREVRRVALLGLGRFRSEDLTTSPELAAAEAKETDPEIKEYLKALLRISSQNAPLPSSSP